MVAGATGKWSCWMSKPSIPRWAQQEADEEYKRFTSSRRYRLLLWLRIWRPISWLRFQLYRITPSTIGVIVIPTLVVALVISLLGGYLFEWPWTGVLKDGNFPK